MGLYLLNATLIWGFSLLAYELLFRNETVHHWNRAYLLLTFGMGLLLPLWTWQPVAAPQAAYTVVPVLRLDAIKASAVDAATPEQAPFVLSWWLVYAAGAAVALLRTVWDVVRILALYRAGTKVRQDHWTLVETDRSHSPFSFYQWVFLPAAAALTPAERALVLRHERRHGLLLHSIDVLVFQVAQIAFWFHPLVYWYRRRLELVHEYQADAAAGDDVQTYGQLLLTQAAGRPLPTLVHSFHRSPLKNRIAMLVKHPSGAVRLLRYVVTVPLVAGCALFCSRVASAQDKIVTGNKMVYKGNEFTLSEAKTDTVRLNDTAGGAAGAAVALDGAQEIMVTLEPSPEKLNEETIYKEGDPGFTRGPVYAGPEKSASQQLFKAIRPALSRLPDGIYCVPLSSPVISSKGDMVYHQSYGIQYPGVDMGPGSQAKLDSLKRTRKPIDPALKQEIDGVIEQAMRQPFRFRPGIRNGQPVAAYLEGDMDLSGGQYIQVKDGVARLVAARR